MQVKMNSHTEGVIFDFSEVSLDYNVDWKLKQILDKLYDRSRIEALGLTQNNITPNIFDTITQTLNPSQFTNLKLLDLSNNPLDETCIKTLLQWLILPSKPYIRLCRTEISNKRVKKLYHQLMQVVPEEALMLQIIFVSKDYVKKASILDIYQRLVQENILPSDWVKIHQTFYTTIYPRLIYQRDCNEYIMVEKQMDRLAKGSPPGLPLFEVDGDESMDFQTALELTVPPWANIK